MAAIDLAMHRGSRAESRRSALAWAGVWIGVAIAFGIAVTAWFGAPAGEQYFAAYLVEKSLSVDNLFVFIVVFEALSIPRGHQRRVLTWGILGAFVMRGVFIALGMAVLARWHAAVFVLGAALVVTAVKLLRKPARGSVPRLLPWLERHLPWTRRLHGERFIARIAGRWVATPLLVALVAIEVVDVVFAADSLPAAFAITDEPFLIYSSNLFALLGLRSLYLVIGDALAELRYLHVGLAGVLAFAGAKMLASSWIVVPPLVSIGVIALVIGAAVLASIVSARTRKPAARTPLAVIEPRRAAE
jgi:tellurite resistance protein TerC